MSDPRVQVLTLLCESKDYCFDWLMESILAQTYPQERISYAAVFDGTAMVAPWTSRLRAVPGESDLVCPEVHQDDRYLRVAELYWAAQGLVGRSDADLVWIVEADQPPPAEALSYLVEAGEELVSGACARRGNSLGLNARGFNGERLNYDRGIRYGELIAATAASCGCMLVDRDLFLGVDWSEFPQFRDAHGLANDWFLCGQVPAVPYLHTGVLVPHVDQRPDEFRIQWVLEQDGYLQGRTEVIPRDADMETVNQALA